MQESAPYAGFYPSKLPGDIARKLVAVTNA